MVAVIAALSGVRAMATAAIGARAAGMAAAAAAGGATAGAIDAGSPRLEAAALAAASSPLMQAPPDNQRGDPVHREGKSRTADSSFRQDRAENSASPEADDRTALAGASAKRLQPPNRAERGWLTE